MKKNHIILLIVVISLLLIVVLTYFNRYRWKIQKVPNDFSLDESGNGDWWTYVRQGENHFKQLGNYIDGDKILISEKDYLDAFKRLLKSNDYWGAEYIIPSTYDVSYKK